MAEPKIGSLISIKPTGPGTIMMYLPNNNSVKYLQDYPPLLFLGKDRIININYNTICVVYKFLFRNNILRKGFNVFKKDSNGACKSFYDYFKVIK